MAVMKVEKNGAVAVLTIDRADIRNPLGHAGDGAEVAAICAELTADSAIRCAILTGAGQAFSAGGDVKAMKERSGSFGGPVHEIPEGYRTNIHLIARSLFNLQVPLIAAVNGPAIGLGCDVACMADIRIAADHAKFGVTFLKLGLIPGDGGAWLLPRIIGHARAAELLFTGSLIDAETALEWGLISRSVPAEDLMDEAMGLAEQIAAQPPQALRFAKSLMRRGATTDFDTIMEMSATTQALMHQTEDHMEGVDALLEKRPAQFKGL